MTTEPKAEGGPDWDMAAHWIDRYAAGVDEQVQLDRVCDALGCKAPPDDWFGPAAMAHPTTRAVEALARADLEYDAAHIEYLDALPDDYYTPQGQCYLADDHPAQVRWDAARQRRSAALAHPEITALLKGETK